MSPCYHLSDVTSHPSALGSPTPDTLASLNTAGSLPPQDLCTCCSFCLEYSSPGYIPGSFLQEFAQVVPSQRGLLDCLILNYNLPLFCRLLPSDPRRILLICLWSACPSCGQGLLSVLFTAASAASRTVPGINQVLHKYLWNE